MSRILIASHPFDGHFNPLTRLAVHLQGRGHDVRWYTGSTYAERIARLGLVHYPFVRATEITADNISEHFPDYGTEKMTPRSLEAATREMFFAPIEPQYRDIAELHEGEFPFDAFICDSALFVSRIVAEKIQPRTYVVSAAQVPAPTSRTAPPPFFGFKPARSSLGRLRDRVVTRLVERTMKSGLAIYNDLRRREGLEPYEDSPFDIHVDKSRAIFQIGIPELEFPRTDWPANFHFIGALMPRPPASTLPAHVTAALQRRATCIVVSQGTTDNRDPDKPFRPALRALAGSEHLVIITTGGRHTESLHREFPQDNVLVEDWLDFSVLLPQVGVFVCNGGFGSVLLALSSAVPLVCAGKLEGKSDTNARIAYRGLGVDLRTERPTPRQIREGVAEILADRGYAERVRDARAALLRYRPLQIVEDTLARDGITVAPGAERQPATHPADSGCTRHVTGDTARNIS